MSDILLPVGYGVLVWWMSTGLALLAVGRSGERSWAALAGAAVLLFGSLAALVATRDDTGRLAHYVAFTAAISAWGAAEITFLTGWFTGPWRQVCPAGATGWRRAGYAVSAILWHELSLLACGAAVMVAGWNSANSTGLWCFAILLIMRVSAKLNVFLGIPNITDGFLPAHLDHLKSFFSRRPMNGFFPVSVAFSTAALLFLGLQAVAAEGPALVGLSLLATLVALAILEHWFFVLPLPAEKLWAWGLAAQPAAASPSPAGGAAWPVRPAEAVPRTIALAGVDRRST